MGCSTGAHVVVAESHIRLGLLFSCLYFSLSQIVARRRRGAVGIDTHNAREEEDETFMRTIVFPEEDRRLFTTARWKGEFRWFRTPNVICLEKYRRLKALGRL
jgi:hypothetical protein